MANRRNWFVMLVIVLVLGLMVIGCEEPEKTYYYEAYAITMSQYNTFANSVNASNNSFSQIQGFRNTLRGFGGTFIESNSGVTESELQSFASKQGLGGVEYKRAKDSLDDVGNIIVFFTYAPSPSTHVIWMYVEKE